MPRSGVELYIAVARMYAASGKFTEAEEQLRQANKKFPDDMRVLLGYAMLKDQMNQPEEALKLYQQVEKKHPKEPSVHNDLAMHYTRYGMLREAIESARRAADLRPREPRYRNNLAALLVEAGMPQEAFKQLRQVYDEPVAHYDLGFLLNKRGRKADALQEFTIALRLSPGMSSARQWVERLSRESGEGMPAAVAMLPPRGPVPGGVAPNGSFPREELPPLAPSPPQLVSPPQYVSPPQFVPPRYAAPPQPYVNPPPLGPPPPQYAAAPQSMNPPPPPVQVAYPVPSPPLVQMGYPVAVQHPAGPQNPPQNAGPQNTGPQNPPQFVRPQYAGPPQYPNPPPVPAANPTPLVASRDPLASGVRANPPPVADGNAFRRLPPVIDSNRQGQSSELVAPIRPVGGGKQLGPK